MNATSRNRKYLLLLAATTASLAAADDLVVLGNGNRMRGSVNELSRGELSFAIAGAGTVDIDWSGVAALQGGQRFDVELSSGERHFGQISSRRPGELEIATDAGSKVVAMSEVIRINPLAATFRERTSGSLDLGFDFLTAKDQIDWTFNAEAENRTANHLTQLSLSSLIRRQDDETSQRRNHVEFAMRRFLVDRWFAIGLAEAEEDIELDLRMRALAGGAAGRTLLQNNRTMIAVYAGLDLAHEKFRGVSGSDDVLEALSAVEWEWFDVGNDTALLLEATTYVGLEDARVRVDLESSLRHDFLSDYYLSLNVYESYNSDPPPGSKSSDLGVAVTFGRSF